MFDVFGGRRCPLTFSVALIAMVLRVEFLKHPSSCSASDRVSSLVQSALKSEIRLDANQRAMLINAALNEDPNSADARWARGDVRIRGQWHSLEEAATAAAERSNLQKYQERRRTAENTVRGHTALAEYCIHNHLPAQERAHWTAVVSLAPNHQRARQRLGHVNVDGAWIDKHQFDKQQKLERSTVAYLEKHSSRLTALSNALQDKSMAPAAVTKELSQFRNPLVIPGLEFLFSRSGTEGGQCTIETVSLMPAPEASISLAKHALDFPDKSVRAQATTLLKQRDEQSYVPALIGSLQARVEKREGFTITQQNQIVWRKILFFESQDSREIKTFNRVFQFSPRMSAFSAFNPQVAADLISESNSELDQLNLKIDHTNERVMQLLEKTTGNESQAETRVKKTPEDWWNWWYDRIESYPSETKPVVERYETSYTLITPPPPSPTDPVGRASHECLAAGTPVWTETGLMAVEQVKIGDLVLSQNSTSGELTFAPVLATSTRPPERLLRLKLKDETVRATGGHPFWVSGKGWIRARSLQPGVGLHTARGVAVLEEIEEESQPAETYNLIVDNNHSYFVGTTLILSHDNSPCEPVISRVPGLHSDGTLASRNTK